MAGSKSVSRRRVEIRYDVQTKGAVANIRKFARENGLQLRKIKAAQQETTRATEKLKDSFSGLKDLIVAAFAADKAIEGLKKLAEVTRDVRGENDALVKSAGEVATNVQRVGAAIGTVFLGAAAGGAAFGKLNEELEQMTANILDAESETGKFVRQTLSGLVTGATITAQSLSYVAEGFLDIKDAAAMARSAVVSFLLAEEGQFRVSGIEDQIRELEGFTATIDRAIRNGTELRSDMQGITGGINPSELEEHFGVIFGTSTPSADRLSSVLTQRLEELRYERRIMRESFGDVSGREQLLRDRLAGGISERATAFGGFRERAGEIAEAFNAALNQSFTLPEVGPEGPSSQTLSSAQDAGRLIGEALADGIRERLDFAELLRTKDKDALQQQVDRLRGSGASIAEGVLGIAQGFQGGQTGSSVPEIDVEAMLGKSAVIQFTNNIGQMSNALGEFFVAGTSGAEAFGESLKNTLGASMSSIGSGLLSGAAQVALGAGSGPLGLLLGLGGAFSLIGGLLSGTGGGGRSGGINASSVSPLALGSIRPDVASGGTAGNTYVIQTGATFFGQDDARRAVGDYARQAVQYGELNLNG